MSHMCNMVQGWSFCQVVLHICQILQVHDAIVSALFFSIVSKFVADHCYPVWFLHSRAEGSTWPVQGIVDPLHVMWDAVLSICNSFYPPISDVGESRSMCGCALLLRIHSWKWNTPYLLGSWQEYTNQLPWHYNPKSVMLTVDVMKPAVLYRCFQLAHGTSGFTMSSLEARLWPRNVGELEAQDVKTSLRKTVVDLHKWKLSGGTGKDYWLKGKAHFNGC